MVYKFLYHDEKFEDLGDENNNLKNNKWYLL